MLSSGTRYSFMRAGRTVKGPHVSATIAMATVVQTRICRSCTFKLFKRVCRTSCGPIARAMNPKVLTAARRIAFLCAFSISNNSKHILIHSFAETNSAPRSATRPTKSMQFSWSESSERLRRAIVLDGCSSVDHRSSLIQWLIDQKDVRVIISIWWLCAMLVIL